MIKVVDIIEDALQINIASFDNRGVEIIREFDEIKPTWIDRHKVLQIITNMVSNAKYAVVENDVTNPTLKLQVRRQDEFIEISLRDNGIGIEKNILGRIFQHGFTTKKNGHGFGLHSSSNMANQMGGVLSAKSEGTNQGAEFILKLPYNDKAA